MNVVFIVIIHQQSLMSPTSDVSYDSSLYSNAIFCKIAKLSIFACSVGLFNVLFVGLIHPFL